MRAVAFTVALLALPSRAHAAEPNTTLSANLIAAAGTIAELRAERALADDLGLQVAAAYAVSSLPGITPPRSASVAAQIRSYALGRFSEGLAIGVEVAGARLLDPPDGRYGISLAARLAYKLGVPGGGFCAELQVGGGPVWALAQSLATGEWLAEISMQGTAALLVGWSL